jgi:sec-independent protein translocase protein TatB
MLNVGPLELLVVLAVALIVVGPERLPELARSVGRALRQLRQVQDEVRDMVSSGVDDEVRQAASDFKKATGDIAKSSGVTDLTRKSGRTAGPRKVTPGRRTAPDRPSTTEVTRPGSAPSKAVPKESETDAAGSDAAGTHPEANLAEPEVAGPPADRLVEDGAAPSVEPPPEADGSEEPATER